MQLPKKKYTWIVVLLMIVFVFKAIEQAYYIYRFTFGAPSGVALFEGMLTKPLYISLINYLIFIVFSLLFFKKLSQHKTLLLCLILFAVFYIFYLDQEVQQWVMESEAKTIDLKLD